MADPTPVSSLPSWPWRSALRGAVLGLALVVGVEIVRIFVAGNFRAVVPGSVYRCSQPSGSQLERMIRTHHIRTIINLRGCCEANDSYMEEARIAARHDISLEDVGCSAGRLPPSPVLRELVAIFDQCEYPVLIHCYKGVDRTGLVSGIALILLTDAPLASARDQLHPRFGHLPLGHTGNMDRFYDLYEEWLTATGRTHSRETFRSYLLTGYCPGECRASYQVLERADPLTLDPSPPDTSARGVNADPPIRVPRGRESLLRLRVTNTSVKPWHLHSGATAGIHLIYRVEDSEGHFDGPFRGGLLEATVTPGQHIDLNMVLPPLYHPGRYVLKADMIDEQHASFFQVGAEPLTAELEVP
jgi:hypothetical protein